MIQAYDSVRNFEQCVAEYAGSKYAVAVDSCTNAIFLACKFLKASEVTLPSRTYFSVPASVLHAGATVKFDDFEWEGAYVLDPYPIVDSALRFTSGMYEPKTLHCLSFNSMKHLKVGKGGMILTDDVEAWKWLKSARYLGRHEDPCYNEGCNCDFNTIDMVGWSMYMTPDMASRGLMLMRHMPEHNEDMKLDFPDLSKYDIYQRSNYEFANRTST